MGVHSHPVDVQKYTAVRETVLELGWVVGRRPPHDYVQPRILPSGAKPLHSSCRFLIFVSLSSLPPLLAPASPLYLCVRLSCLLERLNVALAYAELSFLTCFALWLQVCGHCDLSDFLQTRQIWPGKAHAQRFEKVCDFHHQASFTSSQSSSAHTFHQVNTAEIGAP